MKKLLGLAAILLAFAACNKLEPVAEPAEQGGSQDGIPFTATITAPTTKALELSVDGKTITASWVAGEEIALIYQGATVKQCVVATVDHVDAGAAVITATLTGDPANNADVTLIYPASAVDTDAKEVRSNLLSAQNGALTGANSVSELYDLRTGTGKLVVDGSSASLKGGATLVNQYAIFKLTLKKADGSLLLANSLRVTINAVDYTVTQSPASELYMVLPPIDGKAVSFMATDASSTKYYFSNPDVTFAQSNYYKSTLTLKENPGRLNGQFSVASDKKVYFAQGNLQWFNGANIHKTASAGNDNPVAYAYYNGGAFIFADHQWDICGANNTKTYRSASSEADMRSKLSNITYSSPIDLFMYATSGYCISPSYEYHFKPFAVCVSNYYAAYYPYGPSSADIAETNSDWGVFNAILNGGDETGKWRTLTQPEWDYLLNKRGGEDIAKSLRGLGTVNDVRGLIILPDGWSGSAITPVTNKVTTDDSDKPAVNWTNNVYTSSEWAVMEANGAVFLPAAGQQYQDSGNITYNNVGNTNAAVTYWTSSYKASSESAYALDLGVSGGTTHWRFDASPRAFGRAVRLVKDVE